MYALYAYICVCMHLCVYTCMYIGMHVCVHVIFKLGFEQYGTEGGIVLVGRGVIRGGNCPGGNVCSPKIGRHYPLVL